ncbi:MAG: nucleotidyl transferase AbiEii/AbiGii toxin family protein [Propionibacteriaceae bacterium]|nr:nucleotidyl transferase AbiEii/AbiGii toxin family protein [Propionibacteriaceae bacterium]
MRPSWEGLHPIIADQWGMITTGQAESVGVSKMTISRMAEAGELEQLRHGVYISPQFPTTELTDIQAAWLATDPRRTRSERYEDSDQVVVAEEAAALIHQVGDLSVDAVRFNAARRIRVKGATASSRSMVAAEWQWIDGLPVTSPRRTIEDLVASGRWDDDQVCNVVEDALSKGILTAAEAARSKVLMRVAPHIAPPVSHHSAAQRLRDDARRRGLGAHDSIVEFTRTLFLAAVMGRTDEWVVKGGTGMMCRFGKVRSTKDLDLFRTGGDEYDSPTVSANELVLVMDGVGVGAYTFTCSVSSSGSDDEKDSRRVLVGVSSKGRQVATFFIDVSAKVYLSREPEEILAERTDQADIPGYPRRFRVRLYPLENQMADKVSAMYEVHHNGQP